MNIIDQSTEFNILLKALPTKGNIAWEYNPFRNYRLDEDLYEYDDYYYNLAELDKKFGILLYCRIITYSENETLNYNIYKISKEYPLNEKSYSDIVQDAFKEGNNLRRIKLIRALNEAKIETWYNVPSDKTDPLLREKGELVDFITNELKFNLNHPVDLLPQNSYDDSVNLIMNDGFSYPKIINSRFSPRGKNTYEIVDRKGNSDTNIYDRGDQFKTDTSLYKIINTFPKLEFLKVNIGGALKVGNYFFYFRLSDSDGNETDFFEESGLVSIFKGQHNYQAVSTGERDENSLKQVYFHLTNLDTSYSYVTVYYSRTSAEGINNQYTQYAKIELKYLINNNGESQIIITGFEDITELVAEDINLTYSLLNSAETQASCLNRLFLGNIKKSEIPYLKLTDLSLRFLPKLANEKYDIQLTERYLLLSGNNGYIDPLYIYNKTGYWDEEFYRFGIVYIMKNGELSPVFNVRGGYNIEETSTYSIINLYNEDNERKYIEYNEEDFSLINPDIPGNVIYENVKGVIQLKSSDKDTNWIHYVKFDVDPEVIIELKKYVKGFFFVRQHRIPTILALGITIGIDKHGRVPTLPIFPENFEKKVVKDLDMTHVTLDNVNGPLYVSEGFLERFKIKFEKEKSSIWGQVLKIGAAVVAVAAAVAATIITCGAAGVVIAGLTVAAALSATAIAAGAVIAGTIIAASIDELGKSIKRSRAKKRFNGRQTEAPAGYNLGEESNSRRLTQTFEDRLIYKDPDDNVNRAILCPEYSVNQGYLNTMFTGNDHYIKKTISLAIKCEYTEIDPDTKVSETKIIRYFDQSKRHFFIKEYDDYPEEQTSTIAKVIGLTDNQAVVSLNNELYRARAGEAEEAWKYQAISSDHLKDKENEYSDTNLDWKKSNSDIVRGSYGPYLVIDSDSFGPCETLNIYVPGYNPSNYREYMKFRMNDYSAYKAVSERINILDLDNYQPNKTLLVGDDDGNYEFPIFRGDCYICQYTHRLNRNFCDPSTLYNDEIIEQDCWKKGYDPGNSAKYSEINLADVNAVQLGMWVTFRVRSSFNLNVPTIDDSNISEKLMSGHSRSRYPQAPMSVNGTYKIPDSLMYNRGFGVSLGERYNHEVSDVPYLKQWYGTRIMYSDLQVTDAFKNGFRQFWSTNHLDYALDYGSITKLVTLEGSLLCVFEHGIALIPVNERTTAGSGVGGNVYINTNNVLPLNPKMISDSIGSLWKDSIIKTERGIVYGVDTIAKKIWMYAGGNEIKCISDFAVLEFLNNNISLSERELDPIIGIRNVKTHYNAYKNDVMFTFYDNMYDFEEKAWNLCWNELLLKWITFYSWIPSYSENIYNLYFSFDRNTSKYIAKLGISNKDNDFSDGVVLDNNILKLTDQVSNNGYYLVGALYLANRVLPKGDDIDCIINYTLERDVWGNYKNFKILPEKIEKNDEKLKLYYLGKLEDLKVKDKDLSNPVIYLNIKANITVSTKSNDNTFAIAYVNNFNNRTEMDAGYYKSMIAIILDYNLLFLTTDFWKHGLSGIIDIKDPIEPCKWYGKPHPFEFEFIVKDSEWNHKIFNNLHLLSNKAEPESFHFEVVGESYDFAEFKKNMYIRLEATKELYLYNGSDIVYDHKYKTLDDEVPYLISSRKYYTKLAIFPLYFHRHDKINEIEDYYHLREGCSTKDYSQMAGAEIAYYPTLGEFRVVNHVKAVNMKAMKENEITNYREQIGRLRGNMEYKEDFWNILINPINVVYNNESISDCISLDGKEKYLTPIIFNLFKEQQYPNKVYDIYERKGDTIEIPEDWNRNVYCWDLDMENSNKEVRIKDKYLKVRVRYSGKDLAIITAIRTLYSLSYS